MASFANPSSTTSSLQKSLAKRDLVLVNIAAPDVPVTDHKVALLGSGSYGSAYSVKARDGRFLAVKTINAAKWMDELNATKRQIKAEINSWVALAEHPNIVKYCFEWGWPQGDHLYIAMQYCSGGDLHAKIQTDTSSEVAKWMLQLARGVEWMHKKKVVHRDLYTKNVFLDDQNNVRIGDFGLARSTATAHATQSAAQTLQQGRGYRPFWSPERMKNLTKHQASYPDDMWCVGMIALELLNGVEIESLVGWSSIAVATPQNQSKLQTLKTNAKTKQNDLYVQIEGLFEEDPTQRTTAEQLAQRLHLLINNTSPQFKNRLTSFEEVGYKSPLTGWDTRDFVTLDEATRGLSIASISSRKYFLINKYNFFDGILTFFTIFFF
jgi:serine/threonine protein kinase